MTSDWHASEYPPPHSRLGVQLLASPNSWTRPPFLFGTLRTPLLPPGLSHRSTQRLGSGCESAKRTPPSSGPCQSRGSDIWPTRDGPGENWAGASSTGPSLVVGRSRFGQGPVLLPLTYISLRPHRQGRPVARFRMLRVWHGRYQCHHCVCAVRLSQSRRILAPIGPKVQKASEFLCLCSFSGFGWDNSNPSIFQSLRVR